MAKVKKAAPQPIIDVLPANDSPPDENSRSVIITKRPLMRDPMMAAPASDTTTESEANAPNDSVAEPIKAAPLSVSHQLVITPPSSSVSAQPAVVGSPQAMKPIADVVAPETPALISTEPVVAQAEDKPEPKLNPLNQEAVVAQAEDIEAQRQAKIAALVDSQQYFLPVDGVELKQARYFVALGAVLIIGLAVAWADLTLDAGLVAVQGLPHTTFFQRANVADAPPATAPTTQNYSAPLSAYKLRLPVAWKLDVTKSTAVQDSLTAGPASPKATLGSTKVVFSSGPTLVTTDVAAVIDVARYQKLAHTKGAASYLQELVYHTDQSHFNVVANVVNDNKLKVGDSLKNLTPTFYTADASAASQLAALTTHSNDFPSLIAAQKYTQLNAYQQARGVLLSLTSPSSSK